MGVKGLRQFLRKVAPASFFKYPLSYFSGKKFAIDVSCFMYKFMSVCQGREIDSVNVLFHDLDKERIFNNWLGMFIWQCITFTGSGIIPIYVFDGKPIAEKTEEIQKRGEIRESKLSEIRQELRKVRISDEGEFDPVQIKEILRESDTRISSLMKQVIDLPMSEKMKLKFIFESIGIPTIQSKFDAEKTCAVLAIDGYVDAVYSIDTDAIVYGPAITIYEIKRESFNEVCCDVCSVIYFPYVLASLSLTHEQFVDMCILCGTDYNKNIKGIGPVKSLDGIRRFGRIEDFLPYARANAEEVLELKYEVCRSLFRKCPLEDSFDGPLTLTFDFDRVTNAGELLSRFGLDKYVEMFITSITSIKPKSAMRIKIDDA